MDRRRVALGILLAIPAGLTAQAPPGAPPGGGTVPVSVPAVAAAPADPVLVQHLMGWQKAMAQAANFYSECTLSRKNVVRKTEANYKGSVMVMKPGMARLRLQLQPGPGEQPDGNNFDAYICNPRGVYQYSGADKTLTEYKFPPGQPPKNLLMDFMSGSITAQAALDRFAMKVVKEDQYYVFLEVNPVTREDQQEFSTMTLVLFRDAPNLPAYLPARVVITKALRQETEDWSFPNPQVNVAPNPAKRPPYPGIRPADFERETPGRDWQVKVETLAPAGVTGGRVGVPGAGR